MMCSPHPMTPQLKNAKSQLFNGMWLCRADYPLRSSKITVKTVKVFSTHKKHHNNYIWTVCGSRILSIESAYFQHPRPTPDTT